MRWYPEDHKSRVTIPVGVGEGNKIKWVNFNDFPHWMIAGSTGTGKSNFINVIFCALISQYKPEELRIVAVDLKGGVELSVYEEVPHLLGGVVHSVDGLAERLSQLEAEMTERFAALKRVSARDLFTYNQRSSTSLPRIIVMIDEFASTVEQGDLTKRIHNSILQLTSKGRAVGINIIICTQDPRVDIVPGKIKANCVVRIAGRTASTENSRIIIGSGEAAKIANVKGRMLLKIEQLPIEVQTPLIQDVDIELAIKTAMNDGDAPPMQLPDAAKAEIRWTVEKII
jgi:S-DNA-T family DNA segregation ATPase FtsK/SpoIIIE